jgi:uncharacterized protein involved in exopolysaccharide biosynthesis
MNPRYRETFRRHRLLFLLPVVLGAVVGLTFSLGSPKLYQSYTTLWSDSASAASNEAFGALPPAGQEQGMLSELLTTKSFVNNIATNSPLEGYLETHTSTGWTPTALLKRFFKGTPSLDSRITSALGPKRVTSAVRGQHILEISLDAPEPKLAQETLRALVKEYLRQRRVLAQSVLRSARVQVNAASQALTKARIDLQDYTRTHPALSSADPERQALTQAQRAALIQLNNTTSTMNQALGAVASGQGLQSTIRTVDKPQLPIEPKTGKKRVVETAFAGAFVGGLLSFLLIMFLSRPGRSDAPPGARPATLPEPSPNGGEPAVSEHERAAELLAHQEAEHPSEARRE